GKGRLLLITALRQTLDRLVVEHVDARVHPVRKPRRLPEPDDAIVVLELDDAELRDERREDDRRSCTMRTMRGEHRLEIDVVELVAVARVSGPGLGALLGGKSQPASSPERFRLRHRAGP